MSAADEVYFESHELELNELYHDYLMECGMSEDEFTLDDFRNTL